MMHRGVKSGIAHIYLLLVRKRRSQVNSGTERDVTETIDRSLNATKIHESLVSESILVSLRP